MQWEDNPDARISEDVDVETIDIGSAGIP